LTIKNLESTDLNIEAKNAAARILAQKKP